MAYVNTSASPPYLSRACGGAANFTITGWIKALAWNLGQDAAVYALTGTAASPTDGVGIEKHGVGGTLYFLAGNVVGGPEPDYTTPGTSYAGWIFFAHVVSAGTFTTYLGVAGGSPVVHATGSCAAIDNAYVHNPFSSPPTGAAKYAAIKTWTAALSSGEVAAEFSSKAPVRTSNIHSYLSCDNGSTIGADQSGTGNNWTQVGTGFTTDADLPAFGPTITSQPTGSHVAEGGTASMSIAATAVGGGTLSYQWKKNGTDISGETGTSYTTPALSRASDDNASYTCVVTETGGTSPGASTSAPAVVRVGLVLIATGTVAYSASGGTSVSPTYPAGLAAGDELVLIVGMKPSTADGGTITTPSGWVLDASRTGANDGDTGGYGTSLAADTGDMNIWQFSKAATGSESGSLAVTIGTNNVSYAMMFAYRAPPGYTIAVAAVTGKDTTAGNLSITPATDPGVTAGDYVLCALAIPTDVSTPTQFSAEAITQTGVTFGTITEYAEPDTTTGNDLGGLLFGAPVNSGTSSAAPTFTATAGGTTTNVRGPGIFTRLRATSSSSSANLTAGATASGTLTGLGALACSAAAGASCSGTLGTTGSAASASAGATCSGTLTGIGLLSANLSAGATASGALVLPTLVANLSAGAVCSGTLTGVGAMASTYGGSASATGTLSGKTSLSASCSAGATCSGTATLLGVRSATCSASAAITATLPAVGAAAGTATAGATASGALGGLGSLAASLSGGASVSGTLAQGQLAGSCSAGASCSATLAGRTSLAGTCSAGATATGTIGATGALVATGTAGATASGILADASGQSASLSAGATCSGTLKGNTSLAATITAGAAATGTLGATAALAGACSAGASCAATLTGIGSLGASCAAGATCIGALTGRGNITSSAAAGATCSGTIHDAGSQAASLAAGATCIGTITAIGRMTANLSAGASASGVASGIGNCSASLSAGATCSGNASPLSGLVAALVAGASASGTIDAKGALAAALACGALLSGRTQSLIACTMQAGATLTGTVQQPGQYASVRGEFGPETTPHGVFL